MEGQAVATAGSFTLGTELTGQGGYRTMNLSDWDLTPDTVVAGQSSALGLSLQGISAGQLDTVKTRLTQTQQQLQTQNYANLTGENLSGDLLTAVVWSWFASVESFGKIAQRQSGMIDTPGLQYGFFHADAAPINSYGIIVTSVRFPGVRMDIGHGRRLAHAKDNNQQDWINYNRIRGSHASAMEGGSRKASSRIPTAARRTRASLLLLQSVSRRVRGSRSTPLLRTIKTS